MKLVLTSDTHYGHSKNTHKIHEKFLKRLLSSVEAENIKAVLHAGDWASYKQDQFRRTLALFRQHLKDFPIAAVRGNHDFWNGDIEDDSKRLMFNQIDSSHKKWFNESKIIHLEESPLVIEDVIILGFDGWYNLSYPPTNDHHWIKNNIEGVWFHTYLANRAFKQLEKILNTDTSQYRAAICVTHMPSFSEDPEYLTYCANPKYVEFLSEKFDVVCMGHSHKYNDSVINGCRFLNSGSHYDMPEFKVFEV